ncbi:MAG: hypothetical protein GX249_00775 [Firmicutes bacterium]|nr:hypothetical protein [Bacillota bacterium]
MEESQQRIKRLETVIAVLEADIVRMREQRNVVQRLLVYIKGEHPEVLAKYDQISRTNESIQRARENVQTNQQKVVTLCDSFSTKYPEEAKRIELQFRESQAS